VASGDGARPTARLRKTCLPDLRRTTRRDPSTTPGGRDPFPVRWRGLGLPPGRASELLAALLLTAVPVILFADCVFGGQMLFQRDIDQYWYGAVQALKECVWNGVPPLWNPFDSFGQPLLGFGPWQILYPTTWLTLLVPSPVWYTMFVVVHVAFTSFGLYRLSRSLDMSWGASLIAGGLWAASGPLLSTVTMTNIFAASCWLPWIALAARHAAESRRLGASLAWGLTVGATVLAGSPGMTLVGAVLSAVIVAGAVQWRRPTARSNLGLLRSCVLAATFALGLSAGQWLPTLDVHSRSTRAQLDTQVRTFWSNHPLVMLQSLLPVPLDDLPLRPAVRADFFEGREPFLYSIYLGGVGLALVGVALLGPPRPGRRVAAAGAVVAALLSMGRWTPVHGVITALVPPLQALRYPSKFTIVVALCWALLAGMGLDVLREGRWRGRRLRTGVVAAALLLLAASALALSLPDSPLWRALLVSPETFGKPYAQSAALVAMSWDLRRSALLSAGAILLLGAVVKGHERSWRPRLLGTLAILLGGFALADLMMVSVGLNRTVPRSLFAYRPPALQDVPPRPPNRVVVLRYELKELASRHIGGGSAASLPFDAPPEYEFWLSRAYPLHLGSGLWGIEGVGSRAASLRGREVDALAQALQDAVDAPTYGRLLQLAGVQFVLAQHEDGLDHQLELIRRVPGPKRPIRVFRVPEPVARVRIVGRASPASDAEVFRRVLTDGTFDIRQEVLLAEAEGDPRGATAAEGPMRRQGLDAGVRALEWRPDRLLLETRSDGDGYLVVSDAWDPWWRATVDGREAPVLRANVAFRAVPVPAGTHVVAMRYRPTPVYAGVACSAAFTMLGLVAAGLCACRRSPHRGPHA
jgi:hypothetical protein